mmetsp:Transcript_40190/g.104754  ORF Transcript_40190/g.104754 Transcript_40190/m.104754 type:complete len:289 (-) Transcript_40190:1341-2207(-)
MIHAQLPPVLALDDLGHHHQKSYRDEAQQHAVPAHGSEVQHVAERINVETRDEREKVEEQEPNVEPAELSPPEGPIGPVRDEREHLAHSDGHVRHALPQPGAPRRAVLRLGQHRVIVASLDPAPALHAVLVHTAFHRRLSLHTEGRIRAVERISRAASPQVDAYVFCVQSAPLLDDKRGAEQMVDANGYLAVERDYILRIDSRVIKGASELASVRARTNCAHNGGPDQLACSNEASVHPDAGAEEGQDDQSVAHDERKPPVEHVGAVQDEVSRRHSRWDLHRVLLSVL